MHVRSENSDMHLTWLWDGVRFSCKHQWTITTRYLSCYLMAYVNVAVAYFIPKPHQNTYQWFDVQRLINSLGKLNQYFWLLWKKYPLFPEYFIRIVGPSLTFVVCPMSLGPYPMNGWMIISSYIINVKKIFLNCSYIAPYDTITPIQSMKLPTTVTWQKFTFWQFDLLPHL